MIFEGDGRLGPPAGGKSCLLIVTTLWEECGSLIFFFSYGGLMAGQGGLSGLFRP